MWCHSQCACLFLIYYWRALLMEMELPFPFACLFLIVCCPRPMRLAGCVWAEVRIVARRPSQSGAGVWWERLSALPLSCCIFLRFLQYAASVIAARCICHCSTLRQASHRSAWSAVQVCCQACVAFLGGGLPVGSLRATCSPGADNVFRS